MRHMSKEIMIIIFGTTSTLQTARIVTRGCRLFINVTQSRILVSRRLTTKRRKTQDGSVYISPEEAALKDRIVDITTGFQPRKTLTKWKIIWETYLVEPDMLTTRITSQESDPSTLSVELFLCLELVWPLKTRTSNLRRISKSSLWVT